MSALHDGQARQDARNPQISCCVSAPAGSGKTELLIQRLLALLARVEEPERIVAITFTRKAAAEMRARLLSALTAAEAGSAVAGDHERLTRELAEEVLRVDRERDWTLIGNPSRLRIQTIDSLCGEISRQMPLLSGSGGSLARLDDARPLYREAVESFLSEAQALADSDLSRLLLHLDNDWSIASSLLQKLLQSRDQWQRLLGVSQLDRHERDRLTEVVTELRDSLLNSLRAELAAELGELATLLRYRADNLGLDPDFDPDVDSLDAWRTLADLLLTREQKGWRKQVTKRDGFPVDDQTGRDWKTSMLAMLQHITTREDRAQLFTSLSLLYRLPDTQQDPRHWKVLQSLVALMPRLSAQLLLVFRARNQVDHAQVALAAIAALGDDTEPTDLALRLDYRIEHLLVDEFQDTSSGQYELLCRLTRGWAEHNEQNPQAPRTVMLVGDAMQSIYRFRAANVSLFIQARQHGLGGLALKALSLTVNFRSSSAIVDWVNRHFAAALPATDDPQLGAVRYQQAHAALGPGPVPELRVFTGEGREEGEIDWICSRLEAGINDRSAPTIAVLGRTRRALQPLLAAMRERGIPYSGRDLDGLNQRMVVRDLTTLCEVLQNRYDRYAWLSLLRGPWAALDHSDLLILSRAGHRLATLLRHGDWPDTLNGLSEEGAARLRAVCEVLRWAGHYRDRLALRVWVEEVWLRLGGAAAHPDAGAHSDAEQFLQVLEALEQEGEGLHMELLRERVDALYAAGDDGAPIQVMTLHKAKGLEFDWVFIPALHRGQGRSSDDLLLWDELLLPSGEPAFLLDIRSARDSREGQRVYDYLKYLHAERERLEDTRLLYVGCTRAAERLHLTAALEFDDERDSLRPARRDALLSSLTDDLDALADRVDCPLPEEGTQSMRGGVYRRLQALPSLEVITPSAPSAAVDLDSNRLPRSLGTAVHRCAEALLLRDSLPVTTDASLRKFLRIALATAGCEAALLDEYTGRGESALNALLADDWGRWMLSRDRPERFAELPVTLDVNAQSKHLVLDYVFLDEARDEYWVVDYKTSLPADQQPLADFYAGESERYREQLENYRTALAAIRNHPVRCALYFVGMGMHCELLPEP